jgi:hypothetical protein
MVSSVIATAPAPARAETGAFVVDAIAPFGRVDSVAVGPDGDIYASYWGAILRLDRQGRLVHFAGRYWDTIGPLPAADGRPALEMPTAGALAMTVTSDGSVWIGEHSRVRRIDRGGTVHDLAGDGDDFFDPSGPPDLLDSPTGMDAVDATHVVMTTHFGEVLLVDTVGRISRVTTELLGVQLTDIAVAPDGSLVVAGEWGAVYRVAGGTVTTVVPPWHGIYDGDRRDGIQASEAALGPVWALDVESDGDVIVAAEGRIRRIHVDDGTIGTVAGIRRTGTADGPAAVARFDEIGDLVVAGGDVLVADGGRVRRVAGFVGAPDLPPQPAGTPVVTVLPVDPNVAVEPAMGDPYGEVPPPTPGPVRLTVTATSPDGTPITQIVAGDYDHTSNPRLIGFGSGSSMDITVVGSGLHDVSVFVEDAYGNPGMGSARVLIADGGDDPCDDTANGSFSDVPATSVHAPAIDCAAYWGLVTGFGGLFRPGGIATRGQMASVVARVLSVAGVPLPDGPDAFDDDDGSPHEQNINSLAALGVASGVQARLFGPNMVLNRSQMASFLVRAYEVAIGAPTPPAVDRFVDDVGSIHEPRINQAADLGLANGVSAGIFAPTALLERDQMASFLTRLLARLSADGLQLTSSP